MTLTYVTLRVSNFVNGDIILESTEPQKDLLYLPSCVKKNFISGPLNPGNPITVLRCFSKLLSYCIYPQRNMMSFSCYLTAISFFNFSLFQSNPSSVTNTVEIIVHLTCHHTNQYLLYLYVDLYIYHTVNQSLEL